LHQPVTKNQKPNTKFIFFFCCCHNSKKFATTSNIFKKYIFGILVFSHWLNNKKNI